MKNPMTLQERHQALDDNDAGHDMQRKLLISNDGKVGWQDRKPTDVGEPLNFQDWEYRRKPESLIRFIVLTDNGSSCTYRKLADAICTKILQGGEIHRMIEDPTWTESELEEKNPWRPIIKGEWPECKPDDRIILRYGNGVTKTRKAGVFCWHATSAVEWCYEEDE